MSWIITNKKQAELAGADLVYDEVYLAITPNYIAERYNDQMADQLADQTPAQPGDRQADPQIDHWGDLAPERQSEITAAVDLYCNKLLSTVEDDLSRLFASQSETA